MTPPRHRTPRLTRNRPRGFTLIEVLVVVIIIAGLIAITIPVVSKVRSRAQAANSESWVRQIANACDRYYQDFRAYPGPLSNNEIRAESVWTSPDFTTTFPGNSGGGIETPMNNPTDYADIKTSGRDYKKITMAENLVLGLLGGLKIETSPNTKLVYDPTLVGTGPRSLNPGNLKKFEPYLPGVQERDLSWQRANNKKTGAFFDDASVTDTGSDNPGGADDSVIPEFVDKFPDPMPILYLRARRGASRDASAAYDRDNNGIVNKLNSNLNPATPDYRNRQQYDLDQIIGYTQTPPSGRSPIGVGKKKPKYYANGAIVDPQPYAPTHGLNTVDEKAVASPQNDPKYQYPYDAFAYLRNSALSGPLSTTPPGNQVAREKDKYILISAGPDRVYGTDDDITNFGSVAQ
jgi:prepilin-type N-terminal cleavage/methylation domain-containing protein